jgi:GxxExxY protein
MNEVSELSEQIIEAAIDVHRVLGPDRLESAYETCLWHELAERKLYAERQKALPVAYKGFHIDSGYRNELPE